MLLQLFMANQGAEEASTSCMFSMLNYTDALYYRIQKRRWQFLACKNGGEGRDGQPSLLSLTYEDRAPIPFHFPYYDRMSNHDTSKVPPELVQHLEDDEPYALPKEKPLSYLLLSAVRDKVMRCTMVVCKTGVYWEFEPEGQDSIMRTPLLSYRRLSLV